MAKIHTLKINNYKGIQRLEQVFGMTDFVCLIGRGDSGKTTILEAISSVLSPSWNLTFYDTDFFNCDVSNPIEIEVSLYNLPDSLIRESKFGLYIRGLDKYTNVIFDEIEDSQETILTILLKVEKDLEPKWYVVNNRIIQQPIEIRANDRASLNVFLVSDYIDRHFTWSKGNPLYSLLNAEDTTSEKSNVIIDALREAKAKIDSESFKYLDGVVEKISTNAAEFGVDISNTTTTIDFKDISIKDGKICLHDDKVPFRLKGKGTKRLISIAIQTELAKFGGILLIDEIEQGLEPDRAQHLVKTLKNQNKGQVFITTHSRDVLVELNAEDIFRTRKGKDHLFRFDEFLQGCIRSNPEAFFSERVIVCEGATEIGFLRGMNSFRIMHELDNMALLGIRLADGKGNSQFDWSKAFFNADYQVCLFCDSDVTKNDEIKTGLNILGIKVVQCETGNAIEDQIFKDLDWNGVNELLKYTRIEENTSELDSLKAKYRNLGYGDFPLNWLQTDTQQIRDAIGKTAKKNSWFKRIDFGEVLGEVCCKYYSKTNSKRLDQMISELNTWIENV